MPYLTDYYIAPYILIFARIGFLFGMIGFFIGSTIPMKFKVTIVFWLTLFYSSIIVNEQMYEKISALLSVKSLPELILNEFLIALLIVGIINIFVYIYKILGEFISFSAGLSMTQIYDPGSGTQDQVFNKFFWIMTIYVFFNSELYYVLLVGLKNVLISLEFGTLLMNEMNYMEFYTHKLTNLTLMVFVLAMPFFILTSTVDLFFGYMTRNTPAFNIFSIAFQLKISLVFIFFMLTIDTFMGRFKEMFTNLQHFS